MREDAMSSTIDAATKKSHHTDIFSAIAQNNFWKGTESISGPGSGVERTATIRLDLIELLNRLRVDSILDAPCGDFMWMKELPFTGRYIGVDVVPEIVIDNQNRYGNKSRQFLVAD